MYLETIDEKAFRSFLSNPAISVLDGNVLDKHHNSDFYRFVRVPLSDGEHSVEALFGQMCSNYPTSMSKNHFYEQHNLEFMFSARLLTRRNMTESLPGFAMVQTSTKTASFLSVAFSRMTST